MRRAHPTLPPGRPDPVLAHRLLLLERGFLLLVLLTSLAAFLAFVSPTLALYPVMAYVRMSAPMALAALFCALGMLMAEPGHPGYLVFNGRVFAAGAALLSAAILLERFSQLAILPGALLSGPNANLLAGAQSPQAEVAFLSIAIVMFFVGSRNVVVQHVADVLVIYLGLLTFTLLSQSVFGALNLFGVVEKDHLSPQLLGCILLLTASVVFRQTECGVLSIFLGRGIGSRVARGFALVLILWPFLGRIIDYQVALRELVPEHFVASILTSIEFVLSMALLLVLVWRINDMEKEIHDLTLRDELTGLMNMRGFYLLAEQTYRLAKRTGQPFSVLFLDLDGLKQINDRLGHSMGSAYLAETGQVVLENFRDGDVKGRFGGDEFVVAGQFSMVGIEVAAQRLKATAAERNAKADRKYPLAFSIGYVTVESHSTEALKELVARADALMYKDKQARKADRR
ncbi:MAG TPA: GGDEF domain-containing protein [Terracidiphilus sp.]|nr:GGDEF domain-containing protein [Terracidiphilus sp.]